MNEAHPDPRDRPPFKELQGPLWQALQQIRADAEGPPDAMRRALERAEQITASPPGIRSWWNRRLLAVAGLAAAVLISIGIWQGWPEKKSSALLNLEKDRSASMEQRSIAAVRRQSPEHRSTPFGLAQPGEATRDRAVGGASR